MVTRRDNFGQDFAFIDSFLKRSWPLYYKPDEPPDWPELTLDRVSVGRYDVNGDGLSDLFVYVAYGPLCGTVGCPAPRVREKGRQVGRRRGSAQIPFGRQRD